MARPAYWRPRLVRPPRALVAAAGLVAGLLAALLLGGQRVLRGLRRDLRVLDLGDPADQLLPLIGLEERVELLALVRRRARRVVPDVDVVVVIGHRKAHRTGQILE